MTDLFPDIELDLSRYLRSQSRSQTKPQSKPTLSTVLPRLAGERQPFIPRKAPPPIKEPLRRGPDSVSFSTQQLIDEHRRRELSALAALQKERHFITYYSQFMANILGA